jgi:hypothetical protein
LPDDNDDVLEFLEALRPRTKRERTHKKCPQCEKRKPIGEFSECPSKPSGYRSWCRKCEADHRTRAYRASLDHPPRPYTRRSAPSERPAASSAAEQDGEPGC